jgi:hypothetical protein
MGPFMRLVQGSQHQWIYRSYCCGPDFPGQAGRELDPDRYADLNRLYGL